ncbi:hypothetical protein DL238_15490 [Alteriqipengyuania lutimaris]|uniref:Uncharacterized protein n=1 Tax=Alteriqipengyuania lutimaris TaxID=1538146 RepID=A0A395LN45_9SPHN|nr:hypothetical protein DL238_15490 [Alteriqipengyuania lutimaris]
MEHRWTGGKGSDSLGQSVREETARHEIAFHPVRRTGFARARRLPVGRAAPPVASRTSEAQRAALAETDEDVARVTEYMVSLQDPDHRLPPS